MCLDWNDLETSTQASAKKIPTPRTTVIDTPTGEEYHAE